MLKKKVVALLENFSTKMTYTVLILQYRHWIMKYVIAHDIKLYRIDNFLFISYLQK